MKFGEISPTNLYKKCLLRKTKQQVKDKILGITIKNPVDSIVKLKRNSKYSGSIHNLDIDPFFAHYWTGHQLTIYKDIYNQYANISIDATGGAIKKITRSSLSLLSANIFLYEAVTSTNYGQISVT